MERRAGAVEETRRRIIEATVAAHREQGILATSFQDVARRADVALGTVYRHFPTLEHLVSACGRMTIEQLGLPDSERAAQLFLGARSARARIRTLTAAVAAIYRRGAMAFLRGREARDALPQVARGHDHMEGTIDLLLDEALAPLQVDQRQRQTARALLDARLWLILLEWGLSEDAAERMLEQLALCALRR
jgi:AcrR family transcriptional regulator